MPSYGKIARQGVFWLYLRQAFVVLAGLPAAVVLARLLSPSDFGIAGAALFFAKLSGRLTRAGLNLSLVRLKEVTPLHVSSVFVFNLSTSLFIYLTLVIAAPLIGGFVRSVDVARLMPLAALPLVLSAIGAVPMALLRRDMRFKAIAAIQSSNSLIEAGASVLLGYLGYGYWSIIWGLVIANVVSNTAIVFAARWTPSLRVSRQALHDLFSFGIGTYLTRILEYCAENIDNLLVARLLGVDLLGYYEKAFNTMDRTIGRLNTAGPGISFRIFALIQDDPVRFRRGYRKVITSAAMLGYPFLAFLAAAAPQAVTVLFGPRWAPAILPFRVLCIAGMLKLINEYVTSTTQALGWVWREVWRQALHLVLVIIGIYTLAPFGIVGAAVAVLIATSVSFILMQAMVQRAGNLSLADLFVPHVPALVAASAIVVIVVATTQLVMSYRPEAPAAVVLGLQAAAAGLFMAIYLSWCPFDSVARLVREAVLDYAPRLRGLVRVPSRLEE